MTYQSKASGNQKTIAGLLRFKLQLFDWKCPSNQRRRTCNMKGLSILCWRLGRRVRSTYQMTRLKPGCVQRWSIYPKSMAMFSWRKWWWIQRFWTCISNHQTHPVLQPNSRFQVSSVAVSFWFLGLTKNDTPLQDPEPNIRLSLLGTCCNCCSCCNYVPIVWQRHLRGQWNPPSGTQRANHRPTSMPPQLDRWNSTYTKNTSIQFIASLSASHFM